MEQHVRFLAEALSLARNSFTKTSPNPKVGCVIVKDGLIVGSGVTCPPGDDHAEIVALKDAGERARNADMYVTLEPCCHVGKTGPCTNAIIAAGIARVFVGSIDPNPLVCGLGLQTLREHGVETNLLEDADCEAHLEPFRVFIRERRSWVHLKIAASLDGFVATESRHSKWITGPESRTRAHEMRARADTILVGIGTVLADDPKLTVRHVDGISPIPVVVDGRLEVQDDAQCLRPGTIIFHHGDPHSKRAVELNARFGAKVIAVPEIDGYVSLKQVVQELAQMNIMNLLVEGGATIASSFLRENLVDEISVFTAPKLLGNGLSWSKFMLANQVEQAPTLERQFVEHLGTDYLISGRLRCKEVKDTCLPD